jgi:hypothetical protein
MWIWEYMVLAFKVGVGGLLWTLLFMVVVGILGVILALFDLPVPKPKKPKKPEYNGQPIVVNGGKKDE